MIDLRPAALIAKVAKMFIEIDK